MVNMVVAPRSAAGLNVLQRAADPVRLSTTYGGFGDYELKKKIFVVSSRTVVRRDI